MSGPPVQAPVMTAIGIFYGLEWRARGWTRPGFEKSFLLSEIRNLIIMRKLGETSLQLQEANISKNNFTKILQTVRPSSSGTGGGE